MLSVVGGMSCEPSIWVIANEIGHFCLQVCLVVPWGLQFLFYTLLYRVFPRDRDASAELNCPRRQRSASQNDMLSLAQPAEEPEQYSPPDQDAVEIVVGAQMNKQ
jgi:hypothetical protein